MKLKSIFVATVVMLSPPAHAGPDVLNRDDEPSVSRMHEINTARGVLRYETVAGRLTIRNDESNEPRGYMFYVAYKAVTEQPQRRPVMFVWGGGPGGDSIPLQAELMSPRIIDGNGYIDNPETLLADVDLVFVDAVGTGFSRPAKPDYAAQFYSMGGDIAATTEFIRSYLALNGATTRPIYVSGQSLGTWRASGVAEKLVKAGYDLRGAVLISGQVPGAQISFAFDDAMYIPARTEAAIYHRKIVPDLLEAPDRARADVQAWTRDIYWPALEKKAKLSAAERNQIALQLARFTGVDERLIDRRTLTMTNRVYLRTLIGSDPQSVLQVSDLTKAGPRVLPFALRTAVGEYLRTELGYRSSLTYTGALNPIETSFFPAQGPKPHKPGDWVWDDPTMTPEMMKRLEDGYAPPNANPWLQNTLRADPDVRIFIAAGNVDPMVSCLGNVIMIERLGAELAPRYTNKCYGGGHSIYRERPDTRVALLADIKAFFAVDSKTGAP